MSRGSWIKNRDRRITELAAELSSESPEVVEKVCDALSMAIQLRMLETGGTTTIPGVGDLTVNVREMWSGFTNKQEPMLRAQMTLAARFREDFRRLHANNPTLAAEELTSDFKAKLAVLVAAAQ